MKPLDFALVLYGACGLAILFIMQLLGEVHPDRVEGSYYLAAVFCVMVFCGVYRSLRKHL